MNSKQRFFLYFFTAILFSFSFSILYLYFPKQLQSVDELLRTTMFELRGEIKDSGNIVIVDIDNRSLAQIGQWPWSRNIVAKLLNTLTQAQAGIIGIDMIFAEADRTSPSLVLKNMNIPIKNIANYDTILAQTLAQTPTILSYQFAFGKDIYSKKETPPCFRERSLNMQVMNM